MSRRNDRVNELLRHEISRLLTLEIKDPRLNGVISITQVSTSSDLRIARVFLSVMGDTEAKKDALEGIRSAASFLRRELRPRLSLRYIPFLKFELDESLEEAEHILGIMDSIREDQPEAQLPEVQLLNEVPQAEEDRYIGPLTSSPGGG
jgi:ribosome-binding factor A